MIKRGVPREILKKLGINKKINKIESAEVIVTLDDYQAKLTIPSKLRLEMDLKKGQKCKVFYNKEKMELTYKF